MQKKAIIIGAGPAGLTAAYELLTRTDIVPIILEKSEYIGGISKTVNYKGNRIDIGGHRFFSKSKTVMQWWTNILPLQSTPASDDFLLEQTFNKKRTNAKLPKTGTDPELTDKVMLIRSRLSRILFLRKFFSYPITISKDTIYNLGLKRTIKIGISYCFAKLKPIRNIDSLEKFFISRFGKELYATFFRDYTQKVWGIPCSEIAADWGAQRVKELSIRKAIMHSLKRRFYKDTSLEQKNTDTSLIEQFMYPKYGPGQMWETVADIIREKGGTIIMNADVDQIHTINNKITSVQYNKDGKNEWIQADYFFSTMPVKELINSFQIPIDNEITRVNDGLMYRDFITVGLLLNKLKVENDTNIPSFNNLIPDNWIYIQEKDVKIGRLQVFNNWSPYLLADNSKVWLGLEYFCNESDDLWNMKDDEFIKFAVKELVKIDIIDKQEVIDSTILRVPKAYPAYFGTYKDFDKIREFTDKFENLFLIGRNGMHRYNNQDHSMLTAITAVNNIINGVKTKENIWEVNTEEEYHETK